MGRDTVNALDRFFMAPMSPTRIGVLRIILCTYLLIVRVNGDFRTAIGSMKRPLALMDPSLALHLPIPYPLPVEWHTIFVVLLNVAALCSALGLLTRLSLSSFALMYVYVCSINSSWGFFNHTPAVAAQVLIVLALVPGSSSYSLDRLILWRLRGKRGAWREAVRGPDVPSYALHAVVAVMVAVYLATGAAKLRFSGLEWFAGETLEFSLSARNNHDEGQLYIGPATAPASETWRDGFGLAHWVYRSPASALGRAVSRSQVLIVLLASFTMLFELAAPIAFVGRRARTIYFLVALLFHLGILALMRIPFLVWMVIDLCFLDYVWLKELVTKVRSRR